MFRRTLPLVAFLAAMALLQASDLDDAMRLLLAGDKEKALAMLRSVADKGDVSSQIFLGKLLREPRLVPQDLSEALKWFRRASEQGSGEASWAIGEMYEDGHGVPSDAGEARRLFERAASQGWDQQELTLAAFRWEPSSPSPLSCTSETAAIPCPDTEEMAVLIRAGLHGRLEPGGSEVRRRRGPNARVLVLMQRPVTSEVRLRQPRHTTAAWVQFDDGWKLIPPDAPLLDREIVIHPQPDAPRITICDVQGVDGSTTGGSCLGWPSAGSDARP